MLTVYSRPNCMQCEMTKMWLKQNDIPFEAVDIEANPGALELLKHYGYSSPRSLLLTMNLIIQIKLGQDFKLRN